MTKRHLMPWLAALLTVSLTSCGMKTGVPMAGPLAGGPQQKFMCWGGNYFEKEGPAEARIRDECVHACARYGYYRVVYDVIPPLQPKDPDDDVKASIPDLCMP